MDAHSELTLRLALKRRRKLGSLSDAGFHELEIAVRDNPAAFVDDAEEEAFLELARLLDSLTQSIRDDDLLDDDQYVATRQRRLQALVSGCDNILSIDPHCADALHLRILARDLGPDETLDELLGLKETLHESLGSVRVPATGDAWSDVFSRPRLRTEGSIARICIDSARFRMAAKTCADLLALAPLDALGARYTYALAMARLEDETGFDWLDSRFSRRGNAWLHLGRVLLMYKLDRMPAARRALRGFDRLVEGGAYALLQPVYVDTYLPDRPPFEPGSFQEAILAVHEADSIIADVPDFAAWAESQDDFARSAHAFAQANGLDWHTPEQ